MSPRGASTRKIAEWTSRVPGPMLLLAVLFNNQVRRRVTQAR